MVECGGQLKINLKQKGIGTKKRKVWRKKKFFELFQSWENRTKDEHEGEDEEEEILVWLIWRIGINDFLKNFKIN